MTVVRLDELKLGDGAIPGGTLPVGLGRLRATADGGFVALVRFPAGWERPASGHYPVAEEVVVLDGRLVVSGIAYEPGQYAWLPAGYRRWASHADGDVLAVAWFPGAPTWSESSEHAAEEPAIHVALNAPEPVLGSPSPLGAPGRTLRRAADADVWQIEPPAVGAAAPTDVDLLDVDARVWAHVEQAAPVPRLTGRCLARFA